MNHDCDLQEYNYDFYIEDAVSDRDIFDRVGVLTPDQVSLTVPHGTLSAGKLYEFGFEASPAHIPLNELAYEVEDEVMVMGGTSPNESYSVYYKEEDDDWDAPWKLVASGLSGTRTVTLPVGTARVKVKSSDRLYVDDFRVAGDATVGDVWEEWDDDGWDGPPRVDATDDMIGNDGERGVMLGGGAVSFNVYEGWWEPLSQSTSLTIDCN